MQLMETAPEQRVAMVAAMNHGGYERQHEVAEHDAACEAEPRCVDEVMAREVGGTSDGSTALIVPTTMKNSTPLLRHHESSAMGGRS